MIYLSSSDIEYLLSNLQLDFELKQKLELTRNFQKKLPLEDLVQIDDLCKDRLQTHGFDKNYQTTEEGKTLEKLIDKIYLIMENNKDQKNEKRFGG